MIRNCDKTRLRKKAGLPEEEEEEVDGVAKEWTQARNLDGEVEGVKGEVEEVKGEGEREEGVQGEEPKREEAF